MMTIFIEIGGGVLYSVKCHAPVEYVLIDRDNINDGEEGLEIQQAEVISDIKEEYEDDNIAQWLKQIGF